MSSEEQVKTREVYFRNRLLCNKSIKQEKSTEKPGTSKTRISSIKNPVESG